MTENENKSDGIGPHPRSQTHPNIPRRITHPDLPKGKEYVTLVKCHQPPPSLKPILAFPKGRNKLLRIQISAPT